ncbi:MAG TPA: MFS transporter [Dehalococcoidia bacterium]|nr:MFS transporter [Dehalococcoidia bacterium]
MSHEPSPVMPAASSSALLHRDYRTYFTTSMLTMMGDNIEHVISYWIIFKAFDSPALAGFAVISHWLPYFLSMHFGALADRYDCRIIIRISQLTFAMASLGWGSLYLAGILEMWHAGALLVLHGFSGAVQGPANQLVIHDIVGRRQLHSAVRLNATATQLGFLIGPAVGAGLMIAFGPGPGLLINVLSYIPRTVWTLRVPYSGHLSQEETARPYTRLGFRDMVAVLRELSSNRRIISMIMLAGSSSLLVGNAFQAQMPEFAADLGSDSGLAYGALVAATAGGAVAGGLLLDGLGWLQTKASLAIICAFFWALSVAAFAAASTYALAFLLLLIGGGLQLAFSSMAQTLVQLESPIDLRGRAIGLFHIFFAGLRVGSGFTVGVIGGIIGIHWSLGLSSLALLPIFMGLLVFALAPARERALSRV